MFLQDYQSYHQGKVPSRYVFTERLHFIKISRKGSVVFYPGLVSVIWEVFLDSGKCFGFLELFWILGSVLSLRATVVNPLNSSPALKFFRGHTDIFQ